jgi:hypothetical protein
MSIIAEGEKLIFSLPNKNRAELIGKMLRSLPSPFVADDDDWVDEALRRDREMDEKPETVMTEAQFFSSLREYVANESLPGSVAEHDVTRVIVN